MGRGYIWPGKSGLYFLGWWISLGKNTFSREVRSDDARTPVEFGCDSKRLFSVLNQMYQSYMYMKWETIQRLVHGKRKTRGGGGVRGHKDNRQAAHARS